MQSVTQLSKTQDHPDYVDRGTRATDHVKISLHGERVGGQISNFVATRLSSDGFCTYFEDPRRNSEHIAFDFPGFGIVMATLQGIFGLEAWFRFDSMLTPTDVDTIMRHSEVKSGVFLSASCGISPTYQAAN